MTLLEALVALVILGFSAVGYLEIFQAGARAIRSADEWNRGTALAESALETAVDARTTDTPIVAITPPAGYEASVDVQPWHGRVEDVVVTVVVPGGRTLTVHRLVRPR
jgi:type II secretory pathway pseudopilin PulG